MLLPSTLCLASLMLGATAEAGALKVSDSSAKTTSGEVNGIRYDAKHLRDGKQSTVWMEGEDGSGLGSYVELRLNEPAVVKQLRIWNGHWYTYDYWQRHSRVKELEIEFSDGRKQKVTLADEKLPETINVDSPAKVEWVKLIVRSVYAGNTYNDTAISEVQLIGDGGPSAVPVSAYRHSTTYPEDADGNYLGANVEDEIKDSMWCEGVKEGDGVGEWLEADFGNARNIRKLSILNGNGTSFAYFKKVNSIATATLTFSDGSTEKIEVKAMPLPQSISFPAHNTSSVRLTVDTVNKGTEFNDLCVSELYFYE